MKNTQYVLPYARRPKLEEIIREFHTNPNEKGWSSGELHKLSRGALGKSACSGSFSFLQDVEILEPLPGSDWNRMRLTPFGVEFGDFIVQHRGDTAELWERAANRSKFMMAVYAYVRNSKWVDEGVLRGTVLRLAVKQDTRTGSVIAGAIIEILEKAKLIERLTADGTGRIRYADAKANTGKVLINPDKIAQLSSLRPPNFDLSKLVELCKEINSCYGRNDLYATGMLVRAVLDHVPRIFEFEAFGGVVAHLGGKSFKASMRRLNDSARDFYDVFLHEQIGKRHVLPTTGDFGVDQELGMLLDEVIKKLG